MHWNEFLGIVTAFVKFKFRHNEIAKEQRHKAKLEKDLKNMQNELENKQNETKVN